MRGVLRVAFDDGYEGVVDLQPLIAKGKAYLSFEEFEHSLSWSDDAGCMLDLSADSLRLDAERQAEMHRLMVR
jgi:hypothetical protein